MAKTKADRDTLKTLVVELESCTNLANGLKLIHLSEETVKQCEDNSVERAFVALDQLSEARKLTKQVDMKIFCKAKLYEGKLLLNLFINKEKAKSCFKEVMNISLSERYTNTLWYKEASTLFQQIKKTEEVAKTPSEKRNTCLKELEPQIKELEAAKSLDDESFINFLFEKFPPKHHPKPKGSPHKKSATSIWALPKLRLHPPPHSTGHPGALYFRTNLSNFVKSPF